MRILQRGHKDKHHGHICRADGGGGEQQCDFTGGWQLLVTGLLICSLVDRDWRHVRGAGLLQVMGILKLVNIKYSCPKQPEHKSHWIGEWKRSV